MSTRVLKKAYTMTEAQHQGILEEKIENMREVVFKEALGKAMDMLLEQERERMPNCAICQDTVMLPVKICRTSDHYMCAECVARMLRAEEVSFYFLFDNQLTCIDTTDGFLNCPLCNDHNDIVTRDNILFELNKKQDCIFLYSVIPGSQARIKCDKCDFIGNGLERAHHVLNCSRNYIECQFCATICPKNTIQAHLDSVCPNLPCRFCVDSSTRYTADTLRAHLKIHLHHQHIRAQIEDHSRTASDLMYPYERETTGSIFESNNVPIDTQDLQNHVVFYNIVREYTSMYANGYSSSNSLLDFATSLTHDTAFQMVNDVAEGRGGVHNAIDLI